MAFPILTSIRDRNFDVEKALKNVRIFRRRNFDVVYNSVILCDTFGVVYYRVLQAYVITNYRLSQ